MHLQINLSSCTLFTLLRIILTEQYIRQKPKPMQQRQQNITEISIDPFQSPVQTQGWGIGGMRVCKQGRVERDYKGIFMKRNGIANRFLNISLKIENNCHGCQCCSDSVLTKHLFSAMSRML